MEEKRVHSLTIFSAHDEKRCFSKSREKLISTKILGFFQNEKYPFLTN
jgi:hypothetical protein